MNIIYSSLVDQINGPPGCGFPTPELDCYVAEDKNMYLF